MSTLQFQCKTYITDIQKLINILYTHEEMREYFVKKFIVVYIQKNITLEYTAQILNLFKKHSSLFLCIF